jgi:hypothetical protein
MALNSAMGRPLVATILTAVPGQVPVKAGGDGALTRVLIAGIPGTGKSAFTRWLACHHGFVRCPAGEEPDNAFGSEVLEALVHPRLVIDWGFPAYEPGLAHSLAFVELLIEQEFRLGGSTVTEMPRLRASWLEAPCLRRRGNVSSPASTRTGPGSSLPSRDAFSTSSRRAPHS